MDKTKILPIDGIRLATGCAGIKYDDRDDLVVITVDGGSGTAVFTKNKFCAAPVEIAKQNIAKVRPSALVINSGNANAGTGDKGLSDARAVCSAVAVELGVEQNTVLPFSTGVIGELMPVEKMLCAVPKVCASLSEDGWFEAAQAIMTTDTIPKLSSRECVVNDTTFRITGISKGAGMIHPDMATMLSFIATDLAMDEPLLDTALRSAVSKSFNCISVDGDTSTNDSCVLLTSAKVDVGIDSINHQIYIEFCNALDEVCVELAQAIIRDGEGATKFITINVEEGKTSDECRDVAFTIAHSPLVKTAFFASDPNWGRILAAVGRTPGLETLDVRNVSIFLDDVCVVRYGSRAENYLEDHGQAVMNQGEITVRVRLGRGASSAQIWTTDLSYDYVRINADYRT